MSTKVVVELTPDEEKVLTAFRRVQTEDEKTRASLKLTGEAGDAASKALANGFIRGGKEGTKSISKLLSEMKRSGKVGRSISGNISQDFSGIGDGGRRSIDQIIESIERLQPEVAEKARQMVAEFEQADQANKFDATRRELESMGGDFAILAGQIKQATSEPLEDATKRADTLVDRLREIDPSKAEAIEQAMERAKVATDQAKFDRFLADMRSSSSEAKALADALNGQVQSGLDAVNTSMKATDDATEAVADSLRQKVHPAANATAQGFAAMVAEAKKLRPELSGFIDQWKADWEATQKRTKLDTLRQELRSLGPEFQNLSTEMESVFKVPFEVASKRASEIVSELKGIDPSKAEAMAAAMERAAKATQQNEVERLVQSLAKGNDEAQAVAKALGDEIKRSAAEGEGGIDSLLAKIEAIEPSFAGIADAARMEFKRADEETKFTSILDELRAIDEEATKVADAIAAELGLGADKATADMGEVLAKLRELDPAAAETADRVQAEIKQATERNQADVQRLINRLEQFGPAGKQVADTLKTEMRTAGERSENSIEGIIDKIEQIDPAIAQSASSIHREIKRGADRGGDSMKEFADRASSQIMSVAGSYVGVHEAIQKAIELSQNLIAKNREVLESLKGTESGDSRLLQVSRNEEDFQNLRTEADRIAATYGIKREASRQLVFSGRSEDFESSLDYIGRNAQVISPDAQAQVAGQLPALFEKFGLNAQQAIEGTLQAAVSSRLSFEDIAGALPSAAEGGALAEADPMETMAGLSVLASRFKSADTAADRMKAFLTKVGMDEGGEGRDSLAGKGLIEAIEQLQRMPDQLRSDFLGDSQEVNAAFKIAAEELDAIKQERVRIFQAMRATGTERAPTAIRVRAAENDPRLRELRETRISEVERQLAEERRAVGEANRQQNMNRAFTGLENSGASPLRIQLAEDMSKLSPLSSNDTGAFVDAVGGNVLANLQRDLSLAFDQGDETAAALLPVVTNLKLQRSDDPDALVSRDSAANLINQTTGSQISPQDVSPELQSSLTQMVDREASESMGLMRSMSVSFGRLIGGKQSGINALASRDGSESAQDINRELVALLKRQNDLLNEGNEINRRNEERLDKTERNTRPRPRSTSTGQRAMANVPPNVQGGSR